ncbi:MAG: NAD-dependent DNA ligase LigA [Bacteroidales bacterium]
MDSNRLNKIKERISQLVTEIERHNTLYYLDNAPEITDFEYDLLLMELQSLEERYPQFRLEHSPTLKVGSDLTTQRESGDPHFKQVRHREAMLSLSNTYFPEELYSFSERVERLAGEPLEYVCELKIDGSAISIIYNDGLITRAVTRGDGAVGDDVTQNVMKIAGIPHSLPYEAPGEVELRGEIFMSWEVFNSINSEREEDEEPLLSNPRNAAAGALKLIDSKESAKRKLSALFYSLSGSSLSLPTHSSSLEWLAKMGVPVSPHYKVCNTIEQVIEYLEYWDSHRGSLSFPTDGVVIKVNNIALQQKLGATSKSPRWATAFKFKAEQAITTLLSVDYQVGRTGAITPVANLVPVPLSGSVIKRASLHNKDQMKLLDIHIGDTLYIEKGGEIIPKIVGVDLSKRESDSIPPLFPTHCPDCGTLLEREEGEAKYYCPNSWGCPTQVKGAFLHFCSRKAMNILAGEATIDQLYSLGYIRKLSDLYSLDEALLSNMEGWKKRSIERFLKSLNSSLTTPFERVLYALGIRFVGESTAKGLALYFGSIDSLIAASKEELLLVEDVGEKVANSIVEYMGEERNREVIEKLKEAGLNFSVAKRAILSTILKDKTVVVSGAFSLPRDEIKALIALHSGRVGTSISKGTSLLVAGERVGPSKLAKANSLEIEVIDEREFFDLIGRKDN